MNVKLREIVDSMLKPNEALPCSFEKLMVAPGLTAKVKYQLSRMYDVLSKESTRYQQARVDLVMKLGEEVSPNQWVVRPENEAQFQEQMAELREVEITLYGQRIPAETILEGVTNDVTGGDLFVLRWLIKDAEDTPSPVETDVIQPEVVQ